MLNIVILGAGNVATHLFKAFETSESAKVIQVYNHRLESLSFFKNKTEVCNNINNLKDADLYLICLKDDVIEDYASQLKYKNTMIAHTSGSFPLLQNIEQSGVFYPLQSFSKFAELDYKNIPFCLESNTKSGIQLLKKLAKEVSKQVFEIDSKQRQTLHLAAVFVNNFSNHLYTIAEDICKKEDIPFDILKALILETANKIQTQSPKLAQTGPAVRQDFKTIDRHLSQISDEQIRRIYQLFTNSIIKKYE
ncbi:Rossmann-like and DUF2520 domain-containing protein [Psychroflexus aestuariivivens]|uniref:Rossmann-like and DUF2520 domain-containing protein n=1 Tax=Psychroflexus aestuariivivens TaxID=1795040 RepID=UPI000FDB2ABA|nr:Rossmann-like and DUF2520 domain-containing protein [Psychroflexus aestuariivivens]